LNPVPSHFLSFQPAAFSSCPPSRQRLSVFSVSAFLFLPALAPAPFSISVFSVSAFQFSAFSFFFCASALKSLIFNLCKSVPSVDQSLSLPFAKFVQFVDHSLSPAARRGRRRPTSLRADQYPSLSHFSAFQLFSVSAFLFRFSLSDQDPQ
jgi:hypothetical protein